MKKLNKQKETEFIFVTTDLLIKPLIFDIMKCYSIFLCDKNYLDEVEMEKDEILISKIDDLQDYIDKNYKEESK